MQIRVHAFPAAVVAAFATIAAFAQALAQVPQTLPQTLPPNSAVGRLGSSGPAEAIPFTTLTGNLLSAVSGDLRCSASGTCSLNGSGIKLSPPAAVKTAPVYDFLFANTTNPTTVNGPPAELDHLRCSQTGGGFNKYIITGTRSVVTCLAFEMESEASSNASSNMYGVIGNVANLGAGSTAGLYGRSTLGAGSTGNAVAIKSGVGCSSTAANCFGIQVNGDTTTNGGKVNAFLWEQALQYPSGNVSADYGVLIDHTVTINQAGLFMYAKGAGNLIALSDSSGSHLLYYIQPGGNPTQCGATAGCMAQFVPASFSNWTWNWPSSAGAAGQILQSAGGGAAPNVWVSQQQIVPLSSAGAVAQNATVYAISAAHAIEGAAQAVCPKAGTFRNLHLITGQVGGSSQSVTATLRTNGSDSPLTCAIATGATTCSDTTHAATCRAGQSYSLKVVTSAATGPVSFVSGGVEFDSP
jgi:hypothetical protein